MPKYFPNIEQRSAAWHMLRCGIPTCSEAKNVCTAGGAKHDKPKLSDSSYLNLKLAEWALSRPILPRDYKIDHMEYGTQMEPEARRAFTFQTGIEVEVMGFVINDAGTFGMSPDSLYDDRRGGLELKCPEEKTHVGYMLDPQSLIEEYWVQLHAQWWAGALERSTVMSYCPEFPSVILPFQPDVVYLNAFIRIANDFNCLLEAGRERLCGLGFPKPPTKEWSEALAAINGTSNNPREKFLNQPFPWTEEDTAALSAEKGMA
jgi:hypothetical protein